jgi:DNA primase
MNTNLFTILKTRINILDVISRYTTLKKQGSYYKGLCPFHSEKTPSFTVSPHKEIFYCFACQEGGDVINFIQKVERCTPKEAAIHLAENYGIEIPVEFTNGTSTATSKSYYQVCTFFAQWCAEQLKTSPGALQYLEQRKIAHNTSIYFTLGYCPSGQLTIKKLLKSAQNKNILIDDLLEARIILRGNSNQLYSPFEDRLMFPIADHIGRFCGFGGRIIRSDDQRAKYYNSHDHALFSKGTILFGLSAARASMQQQSTVFLVEGYMDCIALVQAGYPNTVATLGTACTQQHLQTLARYAKKLVMIYDGDRAGQHAMIRVAQMSWNVNVSVSVVRLPENEDPASLIAQQKSFEGLIQQACDILMFVIQEYAAGFTQQTIPERLNALNTILMHVAAVADPLKQDMLLQDIAALSSIPLQILKKSLHTKKIDDMSQGEPEKIVKKNTSLPATTRIDQQLLVALLLNVDLFDDPQELLFIKKYLTEPLNTLYKHYEEQVAFLQSSVFTVILGGMEEEERSLMTRLMLEHEESIQSNREHIIQAFYKKQWKTLINNVKMRLMYPQHTIDDTATAHDIMHEYETVKKLMARKGLL